MEKITLYPTNWLYNAGVIGFLRACAYGLGEKSLENLLLKNECVELKEEMLNFLFSNFEDKNIGPLKNKKEEVVWLVPKSKEIKRLKKISWWWLVLTEDMLIPESGSNAERAKRKQDRKSKVKPKKSRAKDDKELVKNIWGTLFNVHYRGLFNANTNYLFKSSKQGKPVIEQFIDYTDRLMAANGNFICSFCGRNFGMENRKFFNKYCLFTSEQLKSLGSSSTEFPNSFWNNNPQTILCPLCTYFLLHQHLGFNRQLFINAPSFKIMWYLNKYLTEVVQRGYKELREILGMSLLEYALKIKVSLGVWSLSNIELVVKTRIKTERGYEETVDFYSLPSSVTMLLLDKDVASVLNEIGELSILELVMQEKFDKLLEVSHNLIKFQMKEALSENERDYLNRYFYLSKNKEKSKLSFTAYKLTQLYGAIKEVRSRR